MLQMIYLIGWLSIAVGVMFADSDVVIVPALLVISGAVLLNAAAKIEKGAKHNGK